MKKIISIKSLVALMSLTILASCSDLFNEKDIKNNPNAPLPSQVDITPLTTGTLVGLGTLHEDTDVRIAYMWSGQLLGQSRQHQGFWNYTVAASTFGWTNYYNTGQNIRLVMQRATAVNNKLHLGMAQVMEALLFTKLTSLWGDVPYSEAFDVVNHPTPKYDGQLSIYNSLITLLDNAYANLNSGVGAISGDFIYGGDETKWAKAAKTLQARLYLHLKDYTNAKLSASKGINSTDDDMLMPHGSGYQIDLNLNNDFFDVDRPGDCSFDPPAYLPKFMCTNISTGKLTTDVAYRNAKTDESGIYYHFFQYGAETNGLDPNTVDGMFVGTAPQPWLTFYENQLILAEAIVRSTGSVSQAAVDALNSVRNGLSRGYINGLKSGYSTISSSGKISCSTSSADVIGVKTKFTKQFVPGSQMLDSLENFIGTVKTITDDTHLTLESNAGVDVPQNRHFLYNGLIYLDYLIADFSPGGIANPGTKFADAPTAFLTEVASQKFIVTLSQYESFSELRRLRVTPAPVISLGIPINNGTKYPARFIYPQNEINTNPNVPKVSGAVPDQFTALPVFQ